ncbi:hypothetical protein [Nocardia abscessus]|uniref:hypothetical protein n=1 Tax=Nocardia abscessus TaxID=120957 RepID=UPI0005B7AD88|nr:hypothetical protein [Nocardia abscessus]MCC3333605.1 hypothetical protein [Nocardia abscessus]
MDLAELVTAVDRLRQVVTELSERAETQQRVLDRLDRVSTDTRMNRIGLKVATVGVAFNLALTGIVGWLFVRVEHTTREVRDVQSRTSTEILCPLYQVFAVSIKVNPPSPNLTPEQTKFRQEAADTILAGYDKLGCA